MPAGHLFLEAVMKLAARVLALVVVLVGVAAASLLAQQRADAARVRQQLIGTYKLISFIGYDADGTATKRPYSAGQISYDAAGRMSAQLMPADRSTSGSGTGYVAYFGRYEIDAEKAVVTHHVEGSVSANMLGTAMPRYYEFSSDGNTLFLQTKSGERVTGRLQWDRYR
jgi:YD repeat-containing protein